MAEPKKPIKLYFFGDSICFGQYVSTHKTWTTRVSHSVSEHYKARDINVLTQVAAVNGETTRGALMRLEHDVLAHSPTIVWVQFGLNDANYWQSDRGLPRTTVSSFVANMCEICERLQVCGTKRILVSTNHRVTKKLIHLDEDVYSRNCDLYNSELRALVKRFASPSVYLVDVRNELEQITASPDQYLMEDGVHLNEFGHSLYWEYALRNLVALIDGVITESEVVV